MAPRTHHELREAFLAYFADHDHRRLPSSSLVPQSDPTLLFTNAGMVPFKKYFLGEQQPEHPRAATCQKCVRAGGKHNDLENVGYTARHHTFFEMLGNFSFGDYFKRDAIRFAWTFLTQVVGLDPQQLWITVFREDDEARALWCEEAGVKPERILGGDEQDNFWQMGDTGPCGPCSEIHIDQGPGLHWNCPNPAACSPFCDCDRFLEIWNLVFMQYERRANGELRPLPNPSIDTGMGLERLAAVVQGKHSNYDSDLFAPLITKLAAILDTPYGSNRDTDVAMRVIADHARAATFLIHDGVLPDNEGRGYVLRRIMRRAIRYGRKAGIRRPFLAEVTDAVVAEMSGPYPELVSSAATIRRVVTLEEERFGETLERGLNLFEQTRQAVVARGGDTIPGEVVFRLYDTYGFPVDLTALLAREAQLQVDTAGFEAAMQEQRERARSEHGVTKGGNDAAKLADAYGATTFYGYTALTGEGRILALLRGGEPQPYVTAPTEVELIVDRTPFYAEGGGQVADRGLVVGPEGRARVLDVQKASGVWIHKIRVEEGRFERDQTVNLTVDESWRRGSAAHHTATHLLQAALREILGPHVRQAGSLVEPQRLRFDFSHYAALAPEERLAVEDRVNAMIRADVAVQSEETDYDTAIAKGALAFFGEKYGAIVRVVDVPGFSVELCGGTHVERTGQIGAWLIDNEASVSAGVRRLEAVAGPHALARVRRLEADLDHAARLLGVGRRQALQRLEQLVATAEAQANELKLLKARLAGDTARDLGAQAETIGPYRVLIREVSAQTIDELKTLADRLRDRDGELLIALASREGSQPSLFVSVPKVLENELHAGNLLKIAAAAMGARGGGRAGSAQGGGGDPTQLPLALTALREAIMAASR